MARFAGTDLSNFMGDTMDHTMTSKAAQEARSLERKATMIGEGKVANAGVQSVSKVASAGYQAEAIEAGGQAQQMQQLASGISSAVSGIAGGFSSMATGGGGTPAVPRTSLGMGIPGSVGTNGKPMYGPAW